MKKLLIINPNSSIKMTTDITQTLLTLDYPKDLFEVICMKKAPTVLESFKDYTKSGYEVLSYIEWQDMTQYSGVLLACFGDPCLFALKEALHIPVIGIAEASMARALLLGYRFSVIAASDKAVPMMESLIDSYSLQNRSAGVEALHTPIEQFLDNKELLETKLIEAIRRAKSKNAEVIIYGCAAMTMLSKQKLVEQTQVAIIDPIVAGVSTLLAMVNDQDSISKAGLYL